MVALETARAEWEDAHRRLESYAGDPELYARLLDQVEAVTDELAKRVGQTFTLTELAAAYGGVERWTRAAAADPGLRASVERAHEEQRALRPELDLGVGGARPGARGLKCLHAHAAFALARPGYELGERILAEIEPLWPPDGCCTPGR